MPSVVRLSEERTLPATEERACHIVMTTPLPEIFRHRYGAFPPVTEVRDQDGDWGRPGQTRTVVLAGGATLRETLTHVAQPYFVAYTMTDLEGWAAAPIASIEARWLFRPVRAGVLVTWSWTVHPGSRWAALAMPVLQLFWHGYARNALDEIESRLLP